MRNKVWLAAWLAAVALAHLVEPYTKIPAYFLIAILVFGFGMVGAAALVILATWDEDPLAAAAKANKTVRLPGPFLPEIIRGLLMAAALILVGWYNTLAILVLCAIPVYGVSYKAHKLNLRGP